MGLVVCERLVNMPVQVVLSMNRMLVYKIDGALRSPFPSLHSHCYQKDARANRIDLFIYWLYPTRTIFQSKKLYLPILHIPRPGVN